MSVIFFLIVVGVVVAGIFLAAFIWSVKSGQYDDSYSPSVRILFENNHSDCNDDHETDSENKTTIDRETLKSDKN